MSKGIKLPVQVGVKGGVRTAEGFYIRRQNVLIAVTPASSQNPWHQDLTPPEDTIFNLADEMTGGQLVAHIYRFFEEQERLGLTMLPRHKEALSLDLSNSEKGDVELSVNYIDLEDNETREVRIGRGRRR